MKNGALSSNHGHCPSLYKGLPLYFFDPALEKSHLTRDIDANKIDEVKFSSGDRMIITMSEDLHLR